MAAIRAAAVAAARQAHPERFTTGSGLPKIHDLPDSAWINQPTPTDTPATPAEQHAA